MRRGQNDEQEISAFNAHIVPAARRYTAPDLGLLDYLESLTLDFEREGRTASAVLIYAEPNAGVSGAYEAVVASETGFEGIACLDDTARAASLALAVYDRSGSAKALALARRWLTFVEYMQYPDGSFANFIRNAAGIRNATGPTSHRGGYWWSARALLALARAYRLTGERTYLERFRTCRLDPIPDGKISGVLALAELELLRAGEKGDSRQRIGEYCRQMVDISEGSPYLLDHPNQPLVHLWGYHQLQALAASAGILDRPEWLKPCRSTVQSLIEPDVRACIWHAYPTRQKDGVTAYDVAPIVQGLAALHQVTGAKRYRELALRAAAWFYGRNDARTPMYDPTVGRCRDGISHGEASNNYGAESAIEAGMAEIARRDLIEG